ncbi:hypothetical protein ACLB2K_073906 [Fragaria x ananassa]
MASTGRSPFRYKMPHEFFSSKPQEHYHCMEDHYDSSEPPVRYKMPHEFFAPKPQEYYHCMEDDYDDHISDNSSQCSYYSCSDRSSKPPMRYKMPHDLIAPKPQDFNHRAEVDYDDHLRYSWDDPKAYCNIPCNAHSKRSDSSLLVQAPASPHQSDQSEDQLFHTTVTDYDFWSTNELLYDHSSCHSDIQSESRRTLYSPCDSSMVAEGGATTPSPYSSESDSDSDDSLFSLPSLHYSCPFPTTPANEPESYYGPFSPTNSPTAATSPFDCNRCYEMARKPVVTSCGHLYCSVCLYDWLNCEHGRECVVCMRNLYGGLITPIRSVGFIMGRPYPKF